jgi:hypothetical protein
MTRIDAAEQTRVFRIQVSPDGQDWHRSTHSPEDHADDELAATAALAVHHRSPDLDIRVVEVVTITTPVRWVVPATTMPVQPSAPRCQWFGMNANLINQQCIEAATVGSPFCVAHTALEA